MLQPGEVLLEPVGVAVSDPFTDTAATGVEAAPLVPLPSVTLPTTTAPLPSGQVAVPQVAGNQPGPYGGTRNNVSCDKERVITFLESHSDKAAAWAGVPGIRANEIRSLISSLTPVVLTRDTRVTNHGFRMKRPMRTSPCCKPGALCLSMPTEPHGWRVLCVWVQAGPSEAPRRSTVAQRLEQVLGLGAD